MVTTQKLLMGNNTVELPKLLDESIDLTITSPPYDNLRDYHGYSFDFETVAKELYRVTKPGGVVVWIVNDATVDGSETGSSFRQALYFKEIGFNLHDTMIWVKDGFTDVASLTWRYAQVFEYMFILTKGKIKTFNPIKDRRSKNVGSPCKSHTTRLPDGSLKVNDLGDRRIQEFGQRYNVWENDCVKNGERVGHPAQFPLKLIKDHIVSWSNEGDTVLDPFMGSGTTGVACKELNRNFIGIEISEEYFKLATDRINATHTTKQLW